MIFQVLLILLSASPAIAYDQHSTHPSLTYEMAQYFNIKNNNTNFELSSQETRWLMRGAEDEDEPARWINHFYDPVHGNGWSGKHFGDLSQEEGYKTGADIAPKPALPSFQWVTNQEYQSAYGSEYGNQTWQKAIKLYVDGNKQAAFMALGHTLHIVEDATVPDHVRDDSHPGIEGDPGSPFEGFSKEETDKGELRVAENLKSDLLQLNSIGSTIQDLSRYTNANFFSEDTISNLEFNEPYNSSEIITIKIGDNIAKYKIKNGVYLARIISQDTFTGLFVYTTRDKNLVLPSYRDHLFPKAVLTGASVIKLFFEEVEKYKKNPELMEPVVANQYTPFLSALAQAPKRNVIKICGYLDSSCTDIANVAYETKIGAQNFFQSLASAITNVYDTTKIKLGFSNPVTSQSNTELTTPPATPITPPEPVKPPATITTVPTPKPPAHAPKPTPVPIAVENDVPISTPQSVVEPALSNPLPPRPSGELPQPKPSYVLAVGYTPPSSPPPSENMEIASLAPIIESVASTTPDSVASSTVLASEEVTTSTESIVTSTEFVATSTLISSTTLVATTTLEISTTTITTSTLEITTSTTSVTTTIDTVTTTETVSTTTSTPALDPAPPQVVINEVAWAGTSAKKPNDEWFELYNNTDQDINLTGWKIFVSGQQVNLTKINNATITAHSYYLLERKEDLVIRDIVADAIYSLFGGFNNNGEKLELFNPDGAKVDEADASGGWFAGDNAKYRSMERLDSTKNGSDPTNWQSAISYRVVGINVNHNPVYGSPRQPNFGYLVLNSEQEEIVRTLDIKNSPYVVQYYVVPSGKTLNIDPNVDLLLQIYGGMEINGSLNVLGTPDKPIDFIPYSSANWGRLKFNNSTSTFNFANIKQGNRIIHWPQNLNGMILASSSTLNINNSVLWDSETNVIGGTNSVFNISNTAIGATVKANKSYGINARGGALNLDNVNFSNLQIGLEAGCSDCSHPELRKTNMPDSNFSNVDYIAEPLSWWNAVSSTSP